MLQRVSMFPVRCYTCNALVADRAARYEARVRAGEEAAEVLDALGARRMCCRRMFLGYVPQQVDPAHGRVDTQLSSSTTLRRFAPHSRVVSCD